MMNSFFDKMGEKLMPFGVCQEKCVSNLKITKK